MEFTIQDTLSGVFSDVTTTYLNRLAVPPRIVDISDPRIDDATDPRLVETTDPRTFETTDPILNDASNTDPWFDVLDLIIANRENIVSKIFIDFND